MATTAIEDVQPRVKAALESSPLYELRAIDVKPCEDSLLISGCVSSFYHKQLAQELVRSVCTDLKIINAICVDSEEEKA